MTLYASFILRFAFICITLCGALNAQASAVYMYAAPGSYVGGNLPSNGLILVGGVDTNFGSINSNDQGAYVYTTQANGWQFRFAAPKLSPSDGLTMSRPLTVGHYAMVRRWPFNGNASPGMDVSGMNRGYNILSGWFDILEISYDAAFQVTSLAVDFAEFGESLTEFGPAFTGSLRFNSDIPLTIPVPIPEPPSLALFAVGLLMLVRMRRLLDMRRQ